MNDEVERIAEDIQRQYPVTVERVSRDRDHVSGAHPERAAVYREAARNRLWQAKAMRRLTGLNASDD